MVSLSQIQREKTIPAPFTASWLIAYLKRQDWISKVYNTRPQYIDWQQQAPFVKIELLENSVPEKKNLPTVFLTFSVTQNRIKCLAYCAELDTQANMDFPSIYQVSTKIRANNLDDYVGYFCSNNANRSITHERHIQYLINQESQYFDVRYLAIQQLAIAGYKASQSLVDQMLWDASKGCSLDKYKGNFK